MKYSFLVIIAFFSQLLHAQDLRGIVKDSASAQPLAFVSVLVSGQSSISAMSDIDGQFKLQNIQFPCDLQFSYVGFRPLRMHFISAPSSKIVIHLVPSLLELKAFEVQAGENPAHRIIKETWKRRDEHDPEKLPNYSCGIYNKMVITGRPDSTYEAKTFDDLADVKSLDSVFSMQHLFMIESDNKRYRKGAKVKEEVLGSKVSGLKEASFLTLALKFQPFTFYEPIVELAGQPYVNPISRNSEALYFFSLEDTLFSGTDTTYVISFHPRKGKVFKSLDGVIYISAPDYAISHVIADPIEDASQRKMNIRQQYKRLADGTWFPEQIITSLEFTNIKLPGYRAVAESRAYIKDVDLKTKLPNSFFDEVEYEVNKDASNRDTLYWENVRIEDLTESEIATYYFVDSLFKAQNVERKMSGLEALAKGYLKIRWFNLDLNRILRINEHEGWRLGAGGITNEKFSNYFALGGYGAYGFKDRVVKFGGEFQLFIHQKSETTMRLAWHSDVAESGFTVLKNDRRYLRNETFRNYLVDRMDKEERASISLGFRSFKYLHTTFFSDQVHLSPLYAINYANLNATSRFSWLESGVSMVYSLRQSFYRNGNVKLPLLTPNPVFRLQYTHGADLNGNGTRNFERIDLRVEHVITFRRIGKSYIQVNAGYIDGSLPYAKLFNARGNLRKTADLNVSSDNAFETVLMNEFVSDKYASLFFNHDLGPFFKIKKFSPSFILIQNSMIGTISATNASNQNGIAIRSPKAGIHEAGLLIKNLITLSTGGYGIGAYYRYGATADTNWKKNIQVKLNVGILF